MGRYPDEDCAMEVGEEVKRRLYDTITLDKCTIITE